jgi:hypothetical protein
MKPGEESLVTQENKQLIEQYFAAISGQPKPTSGYVVQGAAGQVQVGEAANGSH